MVLSCLLVISVSYAPFNCKGYSYALFSSQVVLMYISIKDKKKYQNNMKNPRGTKKITPYNKVIKYIFLYFYFYF